MSFRHDGPVWQVCWAHPKFGTLLASCSYDKKVILWQEVPVASNGLVPSNVSNSACNSRWNKFHEYNQHTSSVNSIIWAPHELGLVLAACSSDGSASVIDYTKMCTASDSEPEVKRIPQCHIGGCNAISWGPSIPPKALLVNQNEDMFEASSSVITTVLEDCSIESGCFRNSRKLL